MSSQPTLRPRSPSGPSQEQLNKSSILNGSHVPRIVEGWLWKLRLCVLLHVEVAVVASRGRAVGVDVPSRRVFAVYTGANETGFGRSYVAERRERDYHLARIVEAF